MATKKTTEKKVEETPKVTLQDEALKVEKEYPLIWGYIAQLEQTIGKMREENTKINATCDYLLGKLRVELNKE